MNFKYDGKKFQGTRAEILKQIEIAFPFELIDGYFRYGIEIIPVNTNYTYLDHVRMVLIKRIQDQVPVDFEIKIGDIVYHGTKEEIKRNFLDAIKEIDVIFKYNNQFDLLGIHIFGYPDETISLIRNRLIVKALEIIKETI